MSLESVQKKLTLMMEFKHKLLEFYQAKQPLMKLHAQAQESFLHQWEQDNLRQRGEALLPAIVAARDRVGRLIVEASEIASSYGIPTQLTILPAPLVGGYSQTLNIFEAAIEPQLPHDFELEPRKVIDIVNQTIWAIEQDVEKEQTAKPALNAAKRACSGLAAAFRAVFKTETDKVILKWIIYVALSGAILRYIFGVKFEILAKLLADKVAK